MEQFEQKLFERFKKNTWEIKTIEEIVTNIYSPDNTINNEPKHPGEYPAVTGKTIFNSSLYIKNTEVFVDHNKVKRPKYVENGDLLMLVDGFSNLGKTCLYLGLNNCLLGNSVVLIKHNQNPKYLVNTLNSQIVREQIKQLIKKGVVSHIYIRDIKKIKIPIPPLEIQNQIAELLDKFFNLVEELKNRLEKEIENRKEQYNYYKELLLNEIPQT